MLYFIISFSSFSLVKYLGSIILVIASLMMIGYGILAIYIMKGNVKK